MIRVTGGKTGKAIYRPNLFWPECAYADAICTDLSDLPAILRGLEARL